MSKAIVFTDIHFGLNLNSALHVDIAKNNIDFIIDCGKKENADICIFCGDWFHDRKTVSIFVQNESYDKLKELCQHFTKVYMIVGNHDSYYRDKIDVNSLKVFENICTVVSDLTELTEANICGCTVGLCPWGMEDKIWNKHYDFLFGHFSPNGVKLTSGTSAGNSYNCENLTNVAPIVFSGHYHIHSEYETNNGTVIMVGSPSQQTWGDIGNSNGCYVVDFATRNYKFIENTKAPKHIKLYYSSIIKKEKSISKSLLAGNFIRLVLDVPYEYEIYQKILNSLYRLDVLGIDTEAIYSNKVSMSLNDESIDSNAIKTHEDYIKLFIENKLTIPDGIDKQKLLDIALNIYNDGTLEDNE